MKITITEDNGTVIIDREVKYITAFIDIDKTESCDIEYGLASNEDQAFTIVKMLMSIQDTFDENPEIKRFVDNVMNSDNYEAMRKAWKEDHKE